MKKLNPDLLTNSEKDALTVLRQKISRFGIYAMILYGSTARGESDPESDIDLLIVTEKAFDREKRRRITDEIFEVNLDFGSNFSGLIVDAVTWENGPLSILPIYEEIQREGMIL